MTTIILTVKASIGRTTYPYRRTIRDRKQILLILCVSSVLIIIVKLDFHCQVPCSLSSIRLATLLVSATLTLLSFLLTSSRISNMRSQRKYVRADLSMGTCAWEMMEKKVGSKVVNGDAETLPPCITHQYMFCTSPFAT